MQSCWIQSLHLHFFRNYLALSLHTEGTPVVLTGPNGAGKTNILEAISFLAPGRGLRREKLSNITSFQNPGGVSPAPTTINGWVVSATLETRDPFLLPQTVTIGTGLEKLANGQLSERRVVRLNKENMLQNALPEWVHVIWQTPQMDRLFIDGMSERRKFLDRLIAGTDPAHSTRLHKYEYALRERSRLLRENILDQVWLQTLEETMATEGVALCASRLDFIQELNKYCLEGVSHFPRAKLAITGSLEDQLEKLPAIQVENWIREKLLETRGKDAMTGGASLGPHHSHIDIWHLGIGYPAEICSTGEQKALLLSIMLADCRLQFTMQKRAPLLLLDEILAHLDEMRRESFFSEIQGLGVQAWMTGTDPHVFNPIKGQAQFFNVFEGNVRKGN